MKIVLAQDIPLDAQTQEALGPMPPYTAWTVGHARPAFAHAVAMQEAFLALSLDVRTFAGTWRKDRNLIHHTQLILDRYALPGFAWLQWLAHNAL